MKKIGTVSLQEVKSYFNESDEGCQEETDIFIDRMIDYGFDCDVDLKLRGKLMFWALSEPGYDAGAKAIEIDAHLIDIKS